MRTRIAIGVCALFIVASLATAQVLRPSGEAGDAILSSEMMARMSVRLPVPAERAFDAWTEAAQLVEWFPEWAEMAVAEGEPFTFGWDDFGTWTGVYVEVDRPERLSFTWLPPQEYFPAGAYETLVTLSFVEQEGRTELVLEHSGFRGGAELEAQVEAWSGYLYALRAFLLQPPTDAP